jgi:hypothetical protein
MNKKFILFLSGLLVTLASAEDSFINQSNATEQKSIGVSSSHMYKVKASTDILGRHNSKVAKTPTAYLAPSKGRALLARTSNYEPPITPITGRYENYKINNTYVQNYWLIDRNMDSATYVGWAKLFDDNFFNAVDYQPSSQLNTNNPLIPYSFSTSQYVDYGQEKTFKNVEDYAHRVIAIDTLFNINTLINKNNLYSEALSKHFNGKEIGVYIAEEAQPRQDEHPFTPIHTCPTLKFNESSSIINHASKVVRIFKSLAKNAAIYTVDFSCLPVYTSVYPTRPDRFSPVPIYIGSHSYGENSTDQYGSIPQEVDNYVYNTRVIEFVSAGNAGKENGKENGHEISETGQGLNVITVGAVLHHDHEETLDYRTSIKNPQMPSDAQTNYYGHSDYASYDKPEISNYSNLFFNKDPVYTYNYMNIAKSYTPTFQATSAATPFTAAMVADLLQQKPFYRWHPEVVKALLITASTRKFTQTPHQQDDTDNNHNKLINQGMPNYAAMIKRNRSRYWLGNNTDFFETKYISYKNYNVQKEVITFSEENITKGKTYRIAISWLSDGDRIRELGRIPQDIDLMVSQNGASNEAYSTTTNNPFEFVEFKAENNNNLNITIIRHRNDGGRVMLGYNLYEP